MSELFEDVASIDYPILDADAHVNEPPDLWQKRVPARMRERAPKVLHTEHGDVWSFDDGARLRPVGLTAVAGLSFLDFAPSGMRYETMRAASFNTKDRLHEMDIDGIYAQVLYPSVTLAGASIYTADADLQKACVRAYNEWMLEFCDGSNGRLIPLAIIPTVGLDAAIKELEWAAANGHRGVIMGAHPSGELEPVPEDERFWATCQDLGLPVSVHIGSFLAPTQVGAKTQPNFRTLAFCGKAGNTKSGGHTIPVVTDLLFAGVFDKFRDIDVVIVEANIGWIPTVLEQTDDMFMRYRFFTGATEQMNIMPSRLFHESFWASFMVDRVGMQLLDHMNVDHLMWSTDYPHTGSDWPNSRWTIERVFRGIRQDLVKKFLHDNCKALYKLDYIPATNEDLRLQHGQRETPRRRATTTGAKKVPAKATSKR